MYVLELLGHGRVGEAIHPREPLPSEKGTTLNVLRTFPAKPRPESGLDCLMCATFARSGAGGLLLRRNVKRFRGGLVFRADRLCVSLNSRLESNKEGGTRDRELLDPV